MNNCSSSYPQVRCEGQKLKKIFDLQGRIFQTCMGERRLTSVTLFTPSTVIMIGKNQKVFSTRELQLQSPSCRQTDPLSNYI